MEGQEREQNDLIVSKVLSQLRPLINNLVQTGMQSSTSSRSTAYDGSSVNEENGAPLRSTRAKFAASLSSVPQDHGNVVLSLRSMRSTRESLSTTRRASLSR